jgi:predicted NAD/FAD-binding protein
LQAALALLNSIDDMLSLGNYLRQHHYNEAFIDDLILAMTGALWAGTQQ